MPYKTIYDLTTQPALTWRSVALPLGLALAALILCGRALAGMG